jgi:hypothetical protein
VINQPEDLAEDGVVRLLGNAALSPGVKGGEVPLNGRREPGLGRGLVIDAARKIKKVMIKRSATDGQYS